jgi:hypothetical protein
MREAGFMIGLSRLLCRKQFQWVSTVHDPVGRILPNRLSVPTLSIGKLPCLSASNVIEIKLNGFIAVGICRIGQILTRRLRAENEMLRDDVIELTDILDSIDVHSYLATAPTSLRSHCYQRNLSQRPAKAGSFECKPERPI